MFDGRLRSGVDRAVKPVGEALRKTRLAPDHLTAAGLLLAVPTAWAIGSGRLGLGLALLVFSAVPDLLDGALAKAAGRATVRGAFFDSVADRVTDGLVLGGFAWYLQDRYHGHAFALPLAILGVSLLVSYQRAKAESLGFDAKGGIMERAERVVVLCVALAVSAIAVPLLWAMLVLTSFTAVQRFVKVWRQATAAGPGATAAARAGRPTRAGGSQAGTDPLPATVSARWRAWREASGWTPRPDRFARGTRRSGASERWRQRRRSRTTGVDDRGEGTARERPGSRRP